MKKIFLILTIVLVTSSLNACNCTDNNPNCSKENTRDITCSNQKCDLNNYTLPTENEDNN